MRIGEVLSAQLDRPAESLWHMRNGYALCTRAGLDAIAELLATLHPNQRDALCEKLCIGLHSLVEVTDVETIEAVGESRPTVSQTFCSALPVAYSDVPAKHWKPFASLVLEAAYEASLWAAVLNARRGASNIVEVDRLGDLVGRNSEAYCAYGLQFA